MNREYGVGDSKYVVICDPPTLGHVTRRMRIALKTLYNGEAQSMNPSYVEFANKTANIECKKNLSVYNTV